MQPRFLASSRGHRSCRISHGRPSLTQPGRLAQRSVDLASQLLQSSLGHATAPYSWTGWRPFAEATSDTPCSPWRRLARFSSSATWCFVAHEDRSHLHQAVWRATRPCGRHHVQWCLHAGLESVRRPTELDLVVVWEVRGSNMWTDDANVLTYSQRGPTWLDDETMLWQHQDPDVLVRQARQALEIVECQQRRASQ